jgi:threonine dehydrogenase-like Zn-dependent dehydrogenase
MSWANITVANRSGRRTDMKAVRLNEERKLELIERPDPVAGPGEVLVRSHYCGICGTDLHAAELDVFLAGVIMGHEFSGEIVDVGDGVRDWSVGQQIVANPNGLVCGECNYCRSGRYNLCTTANTQNPLGVAKDGGMAEYVVLETPYLNAIPEGLDTRTAAWTEPLAVAVRAVRTSPIRVGDSVAVIGGGPVGQLVLQVVRRAGAGTVTVIEPSAFRRELALEVGADETLTPDELDERLDAGEWEEVDLVMECSGHPTAVQTSVEIAAAGGAIRLIGIAPSPPAFNSQQVLFKELRLLGGFIYVEEFPIALDLLARSAIDTETLTSMVTSIDNFADAFDALRNPETTMKVLIATGVDA